MDRSKKRPRDSDCDIMRDHIVAEAARAQQLNAQRGDLVVGDCVEFIGKDDVLEKQPWKRGRTT